MMSFIVVKELKKDYPTAVALRGVDLEVPKGQWLCIMGPSGSGKSTLLNILGGLDRPTSGSVFINGTDLNALNEDQLARFRRENIGFVFQQSHLVPYLDATENVMLAQFFHSIVDRQEAEEALKKVGLGHRLHHRPSQLSGGEQQRVCIARALINSPQLLLADEPTGNLDRENTRMVLELLKKLHEEEHFTIVLVTHDPYVAEWAERIVHMEDGRVVDDVLR
ncbi:MAG: ABC transporter ATP-binding protein [Nitrospirae bacterium]|nr:MAG: ABC transporter ATP-binding protein [Nitrospirota bacterium]